MLYHVIRSML